MMRNLAGSLGLAALFVAIVVGTFAAFGGFGQKASVSSPITPMNATPEKTGQNEQTASASAIGDAVSTGNLSWTVTDAHQESEIRRYTYPPKSEPGDFVSLTFTVENLSKAPVTLTNETITLFDKEGNEYRAIAARNDAFVEAEKNLLFSEASLLEPGETKDGKVNFEVLPTSSGFKARFQDPDPDTGETSYVDLSF